MQKIPIQEPGWQVDSSHLGLGKWNSVEILEAA